MTQGVDHGATLRQGLRRAGSHVMLPPAGASFAGPRPVPRDRLRGWQAAAVPAVQGLRSARTQERLAWLRRSERRRARDVKAVRLKQLVLASEAMADEARAWSSTLRGV